MRDLITRCWDRVTSDREEQVRLFIPGNIQDDDGQSMFSVNQSQAESSSSLYGWMSWGYTGIFGRNGFLSAAPFFPGARISTEPQDDKAPLLYSGVYDALNKTLAFFAVQSASSTVGYAIVGAVAKPPGQQFDIRYILTRDADTNFSFLLQAKSFYATGTFTPIFWLLVIPAALRITLSFINGCMSPETKKRTSGAHSEANSWRECFKLYGWQAVEVLLANVLVNVISLSCGTAKAPVFDDPAMINGMKVILALGLDFLRNSTEKLIPIFQEKGLCGSPSSRNEDTPIVPRLI